MGKAKTYPKNTSIFEMFSASSGTYGNAFLNWRSCAASDLLAYAASYRNAAMNLIAFRSQREFGAIDEAALPILFLYRHAFELYLKVVVYRAAMLTISEQELLSALPRLWKEHSLISLLGMAEPILNAKGSRLLVQSGDLYKKVEDLSLKIDQVDQGSYSFRYPVTSRGNRSLPKNFLTNIFVFSDAVETVLDDLSQFCASLEDERLQASEQMKLALHTILV